MKIIFSSRRHHYVAIVSIFLIMVALLAGMLGCVPVQYTLTIASTQGGTVTTPGEGTFTFDKGTVVNLVAEAEEGYQFVNWTGDVDTIANVNDATTTITMNRDYSVTAEFVKWSTSVNLGPPINTAVGEYAARLSNDMLSMLFISRDRPGGYGMNDIWMSTRPSINASWNMPTNLGATINSAYDDLYASESSDGLTLYFDSNRPGGYGDEDLYIATRPSRDASWGNVMNLGPTINTASCDCQWILSSDELTMYFCSDRPGGHGEGDIWMSTRPSRGAPWGAPTNLGPNVNTAYGEWNPSISSDGLALYFDSDKPGGYGGEDLYMSTRPSKDAPWGAPTNLGSTVNTPYGEYAPWICSDGMTLYFDSAKPGGYGSDDLWVSKYMLSEGYLFCITYVDHATGVPGIVKRGEQECPIALGSYIFSGDIMYTHGDRVELTASGGGRFRLGLNTSSGFQYFLYDPDGYTLDILEGEIFACSDTCIHLRNCGWTHNYYASYPTELRYFVTSHGLTGEVFAIRKNLTVGTYAVEGTYINLFNVTENWKLRIEGPIEDCSHYYSPITPAEYEYINDTYMDDSEWTYGVGGIVELPQLEEPGTVTPNLSDHNYDALAGIIVGAVVGVIALISAVWYMRRRRTKAI